jgi:hypothetical protein
MAAELVSNRRRLLEIKLGIAKVRRREVIEQTNALE